MKKLSWIILLVLIILGYYFLDRFNKTDSSGFESRALNVQNNEVAEVNDIKNSDFLLEIYSPEDQSIISSESITVKGRTNPYAEVFVNEKEIAADLSGNFSVEYELFEGENNIFVTANDSLGNYVEKSVTVYLETKE